MSNLEPLIQQSKQILERASLEFVPYAKVLMFSGGKDSQAAFEVCRVLGAQLDAILHINTRTGIPETTDYVRKFCEGTGVKYIEADAGTAYEDYVLRKGFFGLGLKAHSYTFHILKRAAYERALAHHIRQRKRGRNILLINGARIAESQNRKKNFGDEPIRWTPRQKTDIWVNPLHFWSNENRDDFLCDQKCPINPVSKKLCRSGECMCGSVQGEMARLEAAQAYPHWGQWLDKLEAKVMERFPWGWGQRIPGQWQMEKQGQLRLFDQNFQPLYTSCVNQAKGGLE